MKQLLKIFLFLPLFIFANENGGEKIERLDKKEQAIIEISSFTAIGDIERLKVSITKGLDEGLTINEIKEIMIHLYAYTGFPRSLNALNTFMDVLENRKKAGIEDKLGKNASPLPKDYNSNEYGAKTRAELIGIPKDIEGLPWQNFSPTIDKFLKEHLFADIFVRDILNHKQRELVTISALATMNGTTSQLKSHLNISLNVGLTKKELEEFVKIIETNVNKKQGEITKKVLDEILMGKKK